jgi:hypothetical protein
MKTVEMKKNFKTKSGYTRVLMIGPNEFGKVKYRRSLCYPANEEGKFVEYTQDTYEMTRDEANNEYLKLKKWGYEIKITQ